MTEKTQLIKNGNQGEFLCPQCNGNYIHFPKVTFKLEQVKNLIVSDQGEIEINTEKRGDGEHYCINLHYNCENGHKGTVSILHHEGQAYIEHRKDEVKS